MNKYLLPLLLLCTSAQAEIPVWGEKLAKDFVKLSVVCAEQEFPNKIPESSSKKPSEYYPAFYGCYDWHSAVHGHWAMLRVLKGFPQISERGEIEKIFAKHFQKKAIEQEIKTFKEDPDFEYPYGHAWFFRLVQELEASDLKQKKEWLEALRPFEKELQKYFIGELKKMNRPQRAGAHFNTAFNFIHAYDYAKASKNTAFMKVLSNKSRELFLKDKKCPLAYEPSGTDFVSPCFAEADLMRRILSREKFLNWFAEFLPAKSITTELLKPVDPTDPKDSYLGHLIGLMFQKAWSMKAVAELLPSSDPRKATLEKAAEKQSLRGIQLMFDSGYGGAHWLATFAIYDFSKAYKTN